MKKCSVFLALLIISSGLLAQFPQKLSYQAVIRNAAGKLVQNSSIGMRLNILQGSAGGAVVYTETHTVSTNENGLISLEIGGGVSTGSFSDINWNNGPYFLKTETDPMGGTNYAITSVSQFLSVPYALYSLKAANGFSGDYNDLTNKPLIDGSETKIEAGSNIKLSGTGTTDVPYVISGKNNPYPVNNKAVITSSQTWTVPASVSKIKVELWGAAGGGGGAGAYSYSYNLTNGGFGGSGGYAQKEYDVVENQQFLVVIGDGGYSGINATFWYPYWYGDSDGGNGGDSWFAGMKAAGGTGGKRGSYAETTTHGNAGTANIGTITGYSELPQNNILDVFQGLPRSYINDRVLTSKSGKGGYISGYSLNVQPTTGEGGCAIITLFE
jgi:hypothetical protein